MKEAPDTIHPVNRRIEALSQAGINTDRKFAMQCYELLEKAGFNNSDTHISVEAAAVLNGSRTH